MNDPQPSVAAVEPPAISLGRALVFPFTQRNCLHTLVYFALIQYIPVLGYVLIRGWRFDLARRIGAGRRDALPDWRHFRDHWRHGWILIAAGSLHYLPLWIFAWWERRRCFWALYYLLAWWFERLTSSQAVVDPRWDMIEPGLWALGWLAVALVIYPPIIGGILETGTLRYAQTGRWFALYEFWKNVWGAGENFWDVVRIEAGVLVLNGFALAASLILMATVGGAFLIPAIMLPIYMWTRGALMGQWILKNRLAEVGKESDSPQDVVTTTSVIIQDRIKA